MVVVAEVVGGGIHEEGLWEILWEMGSDAEAAGVHGCLQQGSDGRGGLFVATYEFGCASEVLGDSSVGVSAGEGVGQQPVAVSGEGGGGTEGFVVEGVGDGEGASGQQFTDPTGTTWIHGVGGPSVLQVNFIQEWWPREFSSIPMSIRSAPIRRGI
ncbi:hypothetical protein [Streptomyces olivaceoviridis]|uniref:hypothetical protein n=1 Tax=Streptomyces olivaceoviridis TaxID=1921 RepID=UPI0036CBB798